MSKKNRMNFTMKAPKKSNSDSLFNERERAKKRREALLDQKAFERVQNERFGFTKVGNRFGRAVTRYLGFGKGNLEYFKVLEGGKNIGHYYYSPGTRCKILNIEDDDLNEDILESGMQCIRITGLRKKSGKERGPLFLLFDTKNEANTWERAFRYSKLEGTKREESEAINIEDEEDDEDFDEDVKNNNNDADGKNLNRNIWNSTKKKNTPSNDDDEKNDNGILKNMKKQNNYNDNKDKLKVSFKDIGKKNFFTNNNNNNSNNDKTNLNANKYMEDDAIEEEQQEENEDATDKVENYDEKRKTNNSMIIGEPGDTPIDHNSALSGDIDRDSVLRSQRVVLQTARYLQQKRSYPKDLFESLAKVSKMELEKLMNAFAFSRQVELDSFRINVICKAMLIGLENIGSTIIPREVYGMYETSYVAMISGSNRTRDKIEMKKRNIRMVKDLIDMMSRSNVRLIREVSAVVRKFCHVHRPWEVAIRPARRFDDTRRNLAPRFARILILNQHKENYNEAPPAAAVFLMIAFIQDHDVIFGYKSIIDVDDRDTSAIIDIAKEENANGDEANDDENTNETDNNSEQQILTENDEVEEFDYAKHAPSTTDNGALDVPGVSTNRKQKATSKLKQNTEEKVVNETRKQNSMKKYTNYTINYDQELENEISTDKDVIQELDEKRAERLKKLEARKDARTIAIEKTIKKYQTKIKKHKMEVQDKYMLQDWQDRVEAGKKLLDKHLKEVELEHLKELEKNREKRVNDALEAAKVLKADREGLNLIDLRRTLKNVKTIWVQARSTNLRAINGSMGEGGNNQSLDVKNAIRNSDKALEGIEKSVGVMRERHFKKLQNRKATDDDQVLTADISRTLIEILHENIKLRSQLNAYTEALLLPTLEKQAEFQQDYDDRTVGLDK